MKKYLLSTSSLILLLFWPIQAQDISVQVAPRNVVPERFNTLSETNYLTTLALRGFDLGTQGLFIESLDGSTIFADHQSDTAFNPASTIKVATSLTALTELGPDYHFETALYANGVVDKSTGTLQGDLVLKSTGDPVLNPTDVNVLIRTAIRAGVRRVTGSLVVTGPFSFGTYYTTDRAVKRLGALVRQLGLFVKGPVQDGDLRDVRGSRIASHTSISLREILFYQNAHSSNPTAERVGEAIGGPKAVERFLVDVVGIPQSEVFVGRTSGLDYNRITPRGTVQLFRQLMTWLGQHNMQPDDVLPVAGIDPGTLHTRFAAVDYRGGVVAKTGSLPGTDGGVSALAGIIYTRARGPLLFAIMNTRGPVMTYRKLQDDLVKNLILECGGIPEVSALGHRSSN